MALLWELLLGPLNFLALRGGLLPRVAWDVGGNKGCGVAHFGLLFVLRVLLGGIDVYVWLRVLGHGRHVGIF